MSALVEVEVPGLTDALAAGIRDEAAARDVPVTAWPGRPRRGLRPAHRPGIEIVDFDDDPSISSEAADHPGGWPQDDAVRERLLDALAFVGEVAPEGRFLFEAGWGDRDDLEAVPIRLADLLAAVEAGALRADTPYEVDARA